MILRSDYNGNILRIIVRDIPKCIALIIVQPLLQKTLNSIKIPNYDIPFTPHTNINLGTPNAHTGINIQPNHLISPNYTLLNPVENPPIPINIITSTDNITITARYLLCLWICS